MLKIKLAISQFFTICFTPKMISESVNCNRCTNNNNTFDTLQGIRYLYNLNSVAFVGQHTSTKYIKRECHTKREKKREKEREIYILSMPVQT